MFPVESRVSGCCRGDGEYLRRAGGADGAERRRRRLRSRLGRHARRVRRHALRRHLHAAQVRCACVRACVDEGCVCGV